AGVVGKSRQLCGSCRRMAFTLEPPKVNKSSQRGAPFDIPRLSACGYDVRTARLTHCAIRRAVAPADLKWGRRSVPPPWGAGAAQLPE
ncbi:MAG: hypothetical protein RSF86_05035, partial [Angelakisella sp.]